MEGAEFPAAGEDIGRREPASGIAVHFSDPSDGTRIYGPHKRFWLEALPVFSVGFAAFLDEIPDAVDKFPVPDDEH